MDMDKRNLMVQEIRGWKKSKLLPDHYCDFLLNLYAEPASADEDPPREAPSKERLRTKKAVRAAAGASGWKWLLFLAIFSLFFLIVLHFSSFHPALQIAIALLVSGGSLTAGAVIRPRSEAAGMAWTGAGMLLLAGFALYLMGLHGLLGWQWNAAIWSGCAVFWIGYGIWQRIPLLHFCGWACLALVYAILLQQLAGGAALGEKQLYWLPLAVLFGWSGWFVRRWSKPSCAVLLGVASLMAFMPEATLLVEQGRGVWLQSVFVGKLVLGGGALFLLRNYWIEWVA